MNEPNDNIVKQLISIIQVMFDEIRGDWSDPRFECREGWEALAHLREHLFGDTPGYRHVTDRTLEQFLKCHAEREKS